MAKENAEWVGKARVPFYDYFTLSAVAKSYNQLMPELAGVSFDYKCEDGDVYYNEDDVRQAAELLERNAEKINFLINHCEEATEKLVSASETLGPSASSQSFEAWYQTFFEFLPCLGTVFPLEASLTKLLSSFLSNEEFLKINYARETSTVAEKRSLLNCASLAGAEFENALAEHAKKFSWLKNKMMACHPYSLEEFRERALAIKNPLKELEALEAERGKLFRQSQEVVGRLDQEQRRLVEQFQEVLFLRTARADAVCKAASLTLPLFNAIASKLGLTREQLLMLSKEEVDAGLDGKDITAFKNRPREYSLVSFDGKTEVIWNPDKTSEKTSGASEVKGTVAFKGFAKGRVQKVLSLSDAAKFQKGNIMLSTYTNPNLVPAMEKAAAIVTDFGGMTSHAAIVAREFGFPCVIGT